jgi:hypothetical protein
MGGGVGANSYIGVNKTEEPEEIAKIAEIAKDCQN